MAVLDFPTRFALLARAWRFGHTGKDIQEALGLSPDNLSKYYSGDTKNLNSRSFGDLTKKLANYLESQGYLSKRDLSKDEFIRKFSSSELIFIRFITSENQLPIPSAVQSATRDKINSLAKQMIGEGRNYRYYFLYRLGLEKQETKITNLEIRIQLKPVLRRIPFKIEDIGENYLTYFDQYGWYFQRYDPLVAYGFVFYTKSNISVFAEDRNPRHHSELFMMQFADDLIDRQDANNILRDGVIVMHGEGNQPTAAKVIIRQVAEEFQEMEWADFAKAGEERIYLNDNDRDGVFEADGDDVERIGDKTLGSKPYSWYANRLQIRNYKLHISLENNAF